MSKRKDELLNEFAFITSVVSIALAFVPSIMWSYFLFKKSTLDKETTEKIRDILKEDNINWEVRILPTDLPNALSTGDTRVYITRSARNLFTLDETTAVMLHEIAHSRYLHIPSLVAQNFGVRVLSRWLREKMKYKTVNYLVKKANLKIAMKVLYITSTAWWMEPLVFLFDFALIATVARPLSYRREKQADFFVIKLGYGKQLANALKKIRVKLKNYKPPVLLKPFLYVMGFLNKHPDLQERITYCLDDEQFQKAVESNNKDNALKIMTNKLKGKS